MPMQWSLQDAKNKFSEVVKEARQGRPQMVTHRGRPAVMVVSVETYDALQRREQLTEPSFGDFLLAMPSPDQSSLKQANQNAPEEFERADLSLRNIEFGDGEL